MPTLPKDVAQRLDAMLADPTIPETEKPFRAQELLITVGEPWSRMRVQRVGQQWRFILRKQNNSSESSLTRVNSPDDLPF